MIDIAIPDNDLEKLMSTFAATRQQIDRASLRAINRTIRWVHRTLGRLLKEQLAADGYNVKARTLLPRLKQVRASRRKRLGMVWLGLNAFPLIALGRGRRTKAGRVIRGKLYRQVFHAIMPSGHEDQFKRKSAARLPLIRQYFEHDVTPEGLIRRTEQAAVEVFLRQFQAELNYEVNIKGAR